MHSDSELCMAVMDVMLRPPSGPAATMSVLHANCVAEGAVHSPSYMSHPPGRACSWTYR
jgi:hypothetical protein